MPVLRTLKILWYFLCYKHSAPTALLDAGQIIGREDFNRVHVAFDTVEWDCGADLDPESVMTKSVPVPG
jgi:hypothetical protein